MPTIRIKSKGLPRAQYQNSQMSGSVMNGNIKFNLPDPQKDIDMFAPEPEKEDLAEQANQQNYQNWMQDPRNEMSKSSWAQPFLQKFDLSVPQFDPNKKYDTKGKEIKPKQPSNFGNKLLNAGRWSGVGLGLLSAGVNMFEDRKKQKDWDSWFRKQNLPENMYAVSPGGDRGDFDPNQGIYRPNQLTPPNIGAASVAEYGGTQSLEDMNLIRIRLRPMGQEMMKYGGQSGLGMGLDIGQRRVYTHMPKGKVDGVSNTLNPIPRDQANIEAEKGETAYGDMDGDGALEHFNIGGKRHTQGGTPLNVPEGSFIFSDTKKMIIKDPIILEKFGLSARKEGYTPAEIAKKYDINKYKAIMEDPNTDYVRKNTAQIMIKSFQKKLAELAIIQESMKGFPQGIPEIAKQTNPELAERYAQEFGLEEEGLEDEANEQEQVMERGMTEPEEEMRGEEEYAMDEQSMMPQGMPEEQMMGEEMPEARWGGSRLPRYQGTSGPSTVYNDASFAAVNPFFGLPTPQTTSPAATTPTTPPPAATPAPVVKPGSTGSRTITPYQGGSQPTPTGIANKYQRGTEYLQSWEKYIPGISKLNNAQAQTAIYDWSLKNDPSRVSGMWQQYGLTEKGKKNKNLVGLTDVDPKTGKPLYTFKDRKFNNKELEDLREAYVDELFGVRQLDPFEPTESGVTGYVCTGRDSYGKPQIQSSSYKDAAAMAAAGAVSSSTEAEKQCPETPPTTIPPGEIPEGKPQRDPYGWMTPDIVNLAASAAVPPRKDLPYIAPTQYEQGRLSLEDWRAQAAQRQAMYNKQAEVMGVYGPTTGQGAAQSLAAGQQAEGLAGDIAGVTSRNVDRVNQFLQNERQRKDQFNLLGSNRATELYKGNVIANQQYDNAMRQYANNLAKTYGQGWKNASQLGMLNAVNPMYKVDPFSGRSYFTNRGYGTGKFSKTAGQSMASAFPTLKNQFMAMGMKEDNAEREALRTLRGGSGRRSSASDYTAGYNNLFGRDV